jgi:hypothetical protein
MNEHRTECGSYLRNRDPSAVIKATTVVRRSRQVPKFRIAMTGRENESSMDSLQVSRAAFPVKSHRPPTFISESNAALPVNYKVSKCKFCSLLFNVAD